MASGEKKAVQCVNVGTVFREEPTREEPESKTKSPSIIIIIIATKKVTCLGVEQQNQERLLAASCSTRELRATGRRKRGGNVETGS